MKRSFMGLLFVAALCLIGLGFYRGWFTLSSPRDAGSNKVNVNLAVDPDRMKEDAEKASDKAAALTGKVAEEAKELGDQARDKASPDDE